jgi:hypothetical protein
MQMETDEWVETQRINREFNEWAHTPGGRHVMADL